MKFILFTILLVSSPAFAENSHRIEPSQAFGAAAEVASEFALQKFQAADSRVFRAEVGIGKYSPEGFADYGAVIAVFSHQEARTAECNVRLTISREVSRKFQPDERVLDTYTESGITYQVYARVLRVVCR